MLINCLAQKSWRWVTLTLAVILPLTPSETEAEEIYLHSMKEGRALSLQVLEERVRSSLGAGREIDKELLLLGGLKKVFGFVIDRENRDCILIGKTDKKSPALNLDNLVVAIRNSWLGDTPPGCSIDPRPENLARLKKLAQELMKIGDPDIMNEKLPLWREAGGVQDVKVFGIAPDTLFAKIMVEADYLLKKIADSSYSLNINGFKSLKDLMEEEIRERIKKGNLTPPPLQIAIRFWFYPGENIFYEEEGIIFIHESRVILLTEEEYLASTGQIYGSGKANPLAKLFVESFTSLYEEIAEKEPLYAELEGLYQLVALAKLLKEKNIQKMGVHLDYWIYHYPLKRVFVPSTLPTISHIRAIKFQINSGGRLLIGYLWIPSSGGVSMEIKIRKGRVDRESSQRLFGLKKAILNSRPSIRSLHWDFKYELQGGKR